MSYRRHERSGKLDLSVISLGLIKQQEYQVRTDENEARSKRCISNRALKMDQ